MWKLWTDTLRRTDEHYFQNYVKKKLSPNAKPYVDAYREQLKRDEERNERGK